MPVAILASPSPDPRLAVPRFVCSARILSQSSIGTGRLSKKKFYSKSSFKDVGASKELIAALKAINITQPSHIQALSFEALRTHPSSNLLLADQAGCGKTLAYLGPIVQQLREEEKNAGHRITQSKKPTGIIMVPTAELAGQVVSVARSLSKTAPFRCVALTGARGWRTQRTFLEEGVDVCVGTPQRLLDHVIAETMQLEKCRTLVLDEVDILLGDSFDFKDTVTEIRSCTPQGTQYILVTATIADDIYEDLNNLFPDLVPVIGPHLHQLTQGVTEQLVNCSGGDEINEETGQKRKLAALLSLIQHHKVGRTIIFCNKISTCRKVENFINRHFKDDHVWRVLPHHAAIDPEIRQRNLKDFLKPPGDCSLILVCTDRASRGLDTADVEHVILFDFPRDPSEYVRRVGRTARGPCSEGLVSVLVLGRQVSLAQQIIEKNKRGRPVHRIPSIKS